ncbi:Ig-like domain-containing protein [Methylobacterium crusticola]|uniref:Ig-like domain-containing protein n=1 Tax=Methylobacterium crusticola TaxID=1697972 RepID=UPI001396A184|nr:Ig-like domain-containing protein [Methylobacterium crusticola]
MSPTVVALSPADGTEEIDPSVPIAVAFSRAMAPGSVNGTTLVLEEREGRPVPARVAYDAEHRIGLVTPAAPLRPGTAYALRVGAEAGARPAGALGLALRAPATTRFTTAGAAPPGEDSGAPVLVVVGPQNPFGRYYAEILRAEGLNLFTVVEAAALTPERLASARLVLLTAAPAEPGLADRLAAWVQAGGNLVAVRPAGAWLPLFGLAEAGAPLEGGYLRPDAQAAASRGLVQDTIQVHGPISRFALEDGDAVAHLFETAERPLPHPAVTLRKVGQGQAAALAYDLATTVVRSRQGNPAWVGQERDGRPPRRANDLFYPDHLDLAKVGVPQADEHQRLLANLIVVMSEARLPLPRLWYLPDGRRAALIMAGDDHATPRGTLDAFARLAAGSPSDCRPDAWECDRATSYVTSGTPLPRAEAERYAEMGFEPAMHVDTGCKDSDPAMVSLALSEQTDRIGRARFGIAGQATHRLHCIAWNGWAETAKIQRAHGIRLNLDYYYWSGEWIGQRPGFMTGSGLPMRFADLDGRVLDIYQAATHLVNENGIDHRHGITAMLDKALGPEQFFGVFGTHYDYTDGYFDTLVSLAKARNVALISAAQMLRWLDRRDEARFEHLSWDGHTLAFRVRLAEGPEQAVAMLPLWSTSHRLSGISCGEHRVPHEVTTIKGLDYALFDVEAGSCRAVYDERTSSMPLPARLQ